MKGLGHLVNAAKQSAFCSVVEKPLQEGLVIRNGLAHHVVSDTGMIGAGAQGSIVYFRVGNAISSPTAPIVRLPSNRTFCHRMRDIVDINA